MAFALSALLVLALLELIKGLVSRKLEKRDADYISLARGLLKATNFLFIVFFSLYAASFFLDLPQSYSAVLGKAAVLALLFQSAVWGNHAIAYWISRQKGRRIGKDETAEATTIGIGTLGMMARVVGHLPRRAGKPRSKHIRADRRSRNRRHSRRAGAAKRAGRPVRIAINRIR